ncbi:hypothetical protein HPB49_008480 [Dermacentor silvarum]|uniref:Uncharacterized protein n=1 Tax=Dermacentor silvarum TaxID=543639 RepID=A0ACB8DBL2_DERSI|nr:hypothetical protein HPB49_008480 [Dermacentor silvarum]
MFEKNSRSIYTSAPPSAAAVTDVIRDDIRQVVQPSPPTRTESPTLSYTDAFRVSTPSTAHFSQPPAGLPRRFPSPSYPTTLQADFRSGCRLLLSKIAESQGEPIDLFDLILASASSNIGVFVLGYRYLLGHPEHQHLCKALRDEFMTSRAGSVLSSLPSFVAAFSQYFPSSRTATLIAAMRSIDEFASTHLSHHVATLGDNEDRDFIDAYLRKSKGHEHEAGSTYSLSSLAGNVVSFLLAGAVTASGSLMRELLLVAANQDTVQARIQSEIDTVVGSERHPAWGDRVSTPYTMAFIWEAHRRYTMMPLGVPRR